MVKKWIFRVLALAFVVILMFHTRKLFSNIQRGAFSIQSLEELETASLVTSSDKRTTSVDKAKEDASSASQEELNVEPEVVYEPSDKTGDDFYLDLSNNADWDSGEYAAETGLEGEHRRRLRYREFIAIDCPKYNVILSEECKLRICEYTEDKEFIRYYDCIDGEYFEVSKDAEYFSVTLMKQHNEKTMSPGQWGKFFASGIKIIICTDNWLNYSNEEEGDLVTGRNTTNLPEDLAALLLAGEDDSLADALWHLQVENGVFEISGDTLNNHNITYYVSSSEGDDANSGLNRDNPKKSIEPFSGMSNVNILLKCGDVFEVANGFKLGNNCIYGAYGQGERPVLDFYRELDVFFSPSEGIVNVWEADLSSLPIANGATNKENCNIGHLLIDGEANWKRFVWSSKEEYDPHYIEERGEGAWAVDWRSSILYIHSENDPNSIAIKYAPPLNGLSGNGAKDLIISGIEVRGVGKHALNLTDCENVEVSCCYFNHIGGSVQTQSGMRYGNAFQVWDTGRNISIHNNFASWIFDTCFTNQGSDENASEEHVHFTDNLGAHFFWGIETWGDGYSSKDFIDVTYTGNILYDAVDITNPTTPTQAGKDGKLLGVKEKYYVSYRTGYKYHQMSGINVNNSGTGQITKVEDNIAWNSKRLLVLAGNSREEEHFSALKNNLLYADDVLENACMMRYGKRTYCEGNEYLDSSNRWSVHYVDEEYDNSDEMSQLRAAINRIAGK